MKNTMGKTRGVNDPYEIWVLPGDTLGTCAFECRVRKHYQAPDKEAANPYARTYCSVKTACTGEGYDTGDTYIQDYSLYYRLTEDAMALWLASPANQWREY